MKTFKIEYEGKTATVSAFAVKVVEVSIDDTR